MDSSNSSSFMQLMPVDHDYKRTSQGLRQFARWSLLSVILAETFGGLEAKGMSQLLGVPHTPKFKSGGRKSTRPWYQTA